MTVLLVRHAVAKSRRDWEDDDFKRPLTGRGRRQAAGLVQLLEPYAVSRVFTSPFVRCVETVEPLAHERGLVVEHDDALAEGGAQAAIDLVRKLFDDDALLCSHGDVIPLVLEHFAVHEGLDLGPDPRWAKGSTWVLQRGDDGSPRARYLPPPA